MEKRALFKGNFAFSLLLSIVIIFTLVACQGSNEAPAPAGPPAGGAAVAPYSGLSTQAVLTSTNAEELSTAAFSGVPIGNAMAIMGIDGDLDAGSPAQQSTVANILADLIPQIDVRAFSSANAASGAIMNASKTINGSCGGTATYSIEYDDSGGSFVGDLIFTNYCENGVVINTVGASVIMGNYDDNQNLFNNFSLTVTNTTVTSNNVTYTLLGSITYNFLNANAFTCQLELLVDKGHVTYMVNNYQLSASQTPTYRDISITGRYYHPSHGYVDVTTTTPFRYMTGDVHPTIGVLVLAGDNSGARLTIMSSTTYRAECDADGDGTYEWASGVNPW